MHTLEQLRRGELAGATRLDLSCGLTQVPEEVLGLANTLEILNLSGNQLSELPHWLGRLGKLRILFCSDNAFEAVPEVLGDCPSLDMVGFKANRIRHLPATAVPLALRWLILTDNALQALPDTLGEARKLQKLMLAGNRLSRLPESMAQCDRLALVRIAANRFERLPSWLLRLPSLAWLAYAGNPGLPQAPVTETQPAPIPSAAIALGARLGEGASGVIHEAHWHADEPAPGQLAVKCFKGHVTSDGLPESEMAACLAAGEHAHLLQVIGPLQQSVGAPPALLMKRLEARYRPLAGPPSFASCTRDCYAEAQRFSLDQVVSIARGVASAVEQLHGRGILHGDLYAHNLLVDDNGHCLLSDFGAASFFEPLSTQGQHLQRIETRAFGHLLDELLQRSEDGRPDSRYARLAALREHCLLPEISERPDFPALTAQLLQL